MSKRTVMMFCAILVGLGGALVAPSAANAEPGCGAGSYTSAGTYFLTYTNCSGSFVRRRGSIFAGTHAGTVGQCSTPAPYRTVILATFTPAGDVTSTYVDLC
jgi:hypothetical protein